MSLSSESVPLLIEAEIEDASDGDEDDRHIQQVLTSRRERQEQQFQKNNLHFDVPQLPARKTHHLFISHSNKSREEVMWARNLVQSLEKDCGLMCLWPERDFKPGQQVTSEIQEGILGAMKVVIVLSPDSLDSGWCRYEMEFAFHQAVDESTTQLIPVLFRECEVPKLLRTMNYIDVPKGEDFIFKIRRCFDEDTHDIASLLPAVKPFMKCEDDPVSGKSVAINASKNMRLICRGSSWSFRDLTKHHRYMLRQLGSKFSETVYFEVRNIANKSVTLRSYSMNNYWPHCCSLCCGLSVVIILVICLVMLLFEIARNVIINGTLVVVLLFPSIFVVVPLCMFIIDKWCVWRLRKKLVDYSLHKVRKTKLLVYFYSSCGDPPSLVFAYYDVNPCLEYLTRIIAEKDHKGEDTEMDAHQKAELYIFSYIRLNISLIVKGRLPMSVVNRHSTYLRQKCLCEILQEQLWKSETV